MPEHYTLRTDPQSLRADDHTALCAAAQARGFSVIIVIEEVQPTTIDCTD